MIEALTCCADDYGICPERDAGIVEAIDRGIVNAVSVLVNGTSFASAASASESVGRLLPGTSLSRPVQIGLHFNLTEFQPCAASTRPFRGKLPLLAALDDVDLAEVETELRAQIRRFADLFGGRVPAHVDGHNHVHVFPRIRDVVARVVAELGIARIRLPLDRALHDPSIDVGALCRQLARFSAPRDSMPVQGDFNHVVTRFALDAEAVFRAHQLSFCDAFVGLRLLLHADTPANARTHLIGELERVLAEPAVRTVEIMCHPGRRAPESCSAVDAFCKSVSREVELEMLIDLRTNPAASIAKVKR